MIGNPELHKITTFDGEEFIVNNNIDKLILIPTPADMGLPGIDWQTRKSYQQYGETAVAFNLRSRILRLEYLQKDCSREELFEARKNLLDFLHPRRGGDLTYTFIRADGTKRAIMGRAIGPGFSSGEAEVWQEWDIEDPISIECFDPIWFDPTCITANVGDPATDDELVFPIVFPIYFGSNSFDYSFSITYEGTWFAFPFISITGPCSSFVLEHTTLGKQITFRQTIPAGQTLALNLLAQTLKNDTTGVDWWAYLSSDSDVNQFILDHAPNVSGGVNSFEFHLDGSNADSAVVLQYQNRYVGI